MRTWMVDPSIMCRAHLLGEHREIHALVGMLNKAATTMPKLKPAVVGLIIHRCIEPQSLAERHEELVFEMLARGWNHYTPFPDFATDFLGVIDRTVSRNLLLNKCPECAERARKSDHGSVEAADDRRVRGQVP